MLPRQTEAGESCQIKSNQIYFSVARKNKTQYKSIHKRGKKKKEERRRKKNKPQHENIDGLPIP